MKRIVFTPEHIQYIVNEYVNNYKSMSAIGKDLSVSKTVIRRVLAENNIPIKTTNHTYKADYDTFANIDSNEKAYWLGFIAADGCVYKRPENASLLISISSVDHNHLEKFKKFMNSNVPIKQFENDTGFNSKDKPAHISRIVFNSVKMVDDLIRLNITPRKSLTLDIPNIDEKYYLPFIAGFFDGDGCITTCGPKEYSIGFVGSKPIITWINSYLNINNKLEQRKKDSLTYSIRCGGTRKPYSILSKIYNSTPVHLDRKYAKYKDLEAVVLSRNIQNYEAENCWEPLRAN